MSASRILSDAQKHMPVSWHGRVRAA